MQTQDVINGIFAKQKELGMDNQQLHDASKVPKATIERIKRGDTQNPSLQTIMDLAAAVGYPIGQPMPQKPRHADMDMNTEYLVRTYDDQIARLRAHYTMLLAEKNRWITYLFILCLILVGFIVSILIYDIVLTDHGWLQP